MALRIFLACVFTLSIAITGCGSSDAEAGSTGAQTGTGGEDLDELMEDADMDDADLDDGVDEAADDAVDATEDLDDF